MRGVNKAIIVGNVGNDPDTRYTSGGSAVTSLTVATNEEWKDKQSGQKQQRTEWHNVTFFGKLAEIAGQYLSKGAPVYIEGKIQTDKWQDKEGKDRYTTKIIANEMQMLGSRGDSSPDQPQQRPQPGRPSVPPMDDFDDDLPF